VPGIRAADEVVYLNVQITQQMSVPGPHEGRENQLENRELRLATLTNGSFTPTRRNHVLLIRLDRVPMNYPGSPTHRNPFRKVPPAIAVAWFTAVVFSRGNICYKYAHE